MHDMGIVEEVMTLPGLWHMSVSYPDPIQDHQKPVRIMTCPVPIIELMLFYIILFAYCIMIR